MATKIQDYMKAIKELKQEALLMNQKELVLRAGDLHRRVNRGTPTLVTCCLAMKKAMLEDDQFLHNPDNKSGACVDLMIRYQLYDLDHRVKLYQPQKRGRKAGSKIIKKETKKSGIQESLETWLTRLEIEFKNDRHTIYAKGDYGIWKIRVATSSGRRALNIDDAVYALLKEASDDIDKYTVCMHASQMNQQAWASISPTLRKKMNITALFVRDNEIIEIK